jgi:hypothetical protein
LFFEGIDRMKFSLFALMPAVAVVVADPAPLVIPTVGDLIPNQYIVKLKPNVIQTFFDQAVKAIGRTPKHTYGFGNFVGFAATMPPEILNVVRLLPGVRSPISSRPNDSQLIHTRSTTLSKMPS